MNLPPHQLTMTVLMTPDMANFAGNVHGGTVLKFLDQVAYACASRYAGRYVVTLSVDQVMFLQPIHVGELLSFLAAVNHTGSSSMERGKSNAMRTRSPLIDAMRTIPIGLLGSPMTTSSPSRRVMTSISDLQSLVRRACRRAFAQRRDDNNPAQKRKTQSTFLCLTVLY